MHAKLLAVPFAALICSTAFAGPRVIITEVMYNPASNEKKGESEWVEIANVGDVAMDIKNWRLADATEKRAKKWGTFNCTLGPGQVAVIINADAVTEEQFRAAWDPASDSAASETISYQIIPVKWGALRNNPGDANKGLQLLSENDEVICTVNYRDSGDWPSCSRPDGASIWLMDVAAPDINNGKAWKRSEAGKDGARVSQKTDKFDKQDAGSPGVVTTPTAPAAGPAAETSSDEKGKKDEKKPADNTTDY
jgi:hypothetical protein